MYPFSTGNTTGEDEYLPALPTTMRSKNELPTDLPGNRLIKRGS
jgi:hypothetical protein